MKVYWLVRFIDSEERRVINFISVVIRLRVVKIPDILVCILSLKDPASELTFKNCKAFLNTKFTSRNKYIYCSYISIHKFNFAHWRKLNIKY